MSVASDQRIVAGIHVRQRGEDLVETVVTNIERSGAGWIRRTAGYAVGALIHRFVVIPVKRVARHDAIDVNRSHKITASASVVSDLHHIASRKFTLQLERERIDIGIWLVRSRGE